MTEDTPQWRHDRRTIHVRRGIVRARGPRRLLPKNYLSWHAVYQQTRRWLAARVLEMIEPKAHMLHEGQ